MLLSDYECINLSPACHLPETITSSMHACSRFLSPLFLNGMRIAVVLIQNSTEAKRRLLLFVAVALLVKPLDLKVQVPFVTHLVPVSGSM